MLPVQCLPLLTGLLLASYVGAPVRLQPQLTSGKQPLLHWSQKLVITDREQSCIWRKNWQYSLVSPCSLISSIDTTSVSLPSTMQPVEFKHTGRQCSRQLCSLTCNQKPLVNKHMTCMSKVTNMWLPIQASCCSTAFSFLPLGPPACLVGSLPVPCNRLWLGANNLSRANHDSQSQLLTTGLASQSKSLGHRYLHFNVPSQHLCLHVWIRCDPVLRSSCAEARNNVFVAY